MPGDTRTHIARQARKEKRHDPGDVASLRSVLWQALERVADMLEDENASNDDIRRTAHTLAQLSPAYLKAVEIGELESRLLEIEKQVNAGMASAR